MKKSYLIIGGVLLITVASVSVAFSTSKSKDFSLGESIKQLTNSDKVIAKIDNLPITEGEFASKKLFLETQKNTIVSNNAVIEEIVKQKVILQMAKDRGITVTDTELNNLIAAQKERSTQVGQEEQAQFRDFLAGQGMSVEEYWSDPYVKKAYRNGIYIGKLRKKMRSEVPQEVQGSEKVSEYVNNQINEICSSKRIELIDPAYK